jgi:hypothetical protein
LHDVTASAVPRGVGLIDAGAQYTLGLASTDSVFSATFWRSAVTDGTNNYWGAARTGGTYYFGFDDPAATIQTVFSNMRGMALFNGSIYCIAAVANSDGVLKLDGMPHTATGSNPTVLIDETAGASTGSSDCEVSPDGNLIYVADDRNTPNGGIQRYEFINSVWTRVYTLTSGLPTGARYVTADFHGPNPIVYAITREATDENNRIVRIEDTGAASVGTTVAAAGANQNFRGVRFGPVASPVVARPTLSFTRSGSNLVLSWSGPFTLMSATNVAGPYADVSGQTNPYTNNVTSGVQRFFGLRQ